MNEQILNQNDFRSRGFTLIELLVVIAIIGILISIVSTLAGQVLASAKSTSESASLRSLLQGYNLYAVEHRGKLLQGYQEQNDDGIVRDPDGNEVPWPASGRYAWRIYPYVDNAMNALYVNAQEPILSQITGSSCYPYFSSLYPSFGLNAEWMGGDYRTTASPMLDEFGWYGKFLGDVKHPTRQLVFASARAPQGSSGDEFDECIPGGLPMKMEGYFEIKSPYFPSSGDTWRWNTANGQHGHAPTMDSADHGNLSARHAGKVLVGNLDGSAEYLTLEELADMRRWSPSANTEDWIPSITP